MEPQTPQPETTYPMAVNGRVMQRSANIGNTQDVKMLEENDQKLIEFFERCKREAFADRWIFERQWTRAIHYTNMRQWLAPYSRSIGWRDARIAKGIPKPTTDMPRTAEQAIRAMFTAIKFGVMIKPLSQDPKAVVTASVVDDAAPMIHDIHQMNLVMNEHDYWFVNCGNAYLHSWWNYDADYGTQEIPHEKCLQCQAIVTSDQIADAKQKCPTCGGRSFERQQTSIQKPIGCAETTPLSPLEIAHPMSYPRWSEVPFLIRMRWRNKRYYEEHEELKGYVEKLKFSKASTERSLQIFQSLPLQNDMGSTYSTSYGVGSNTQEAEGIAEYELWVRPSPEHREGLVIRVAGDDKPCVLHLESEGLPGPIPYHDAKGRPMFTFTHAAYHHVGGRVLGAGAHEPVIGKYDQLNRLDSLIEMIVMRMASPQWAVPKGAEVQWLGDSPGLPGLILQWNAQLAGPNGRPERVPGIGPDGSLFQLRQQLVQSIEEGLGTFDILKGAKPAGVEAFSALQLLVERGQQRFANAFQARGESYKTWFGHAIELEREFGPDERIMAIMSPTRKWTFKTFKKSSLRGDFEILIEDGTYTPKTSLGERAAIEHLNQLKMIDPTDPDQQHTILMKFGQAGLVPSLNGHVQAALRKQEAFEEWARGPQMKQAAQMTAADPTFNVISSESYPLKWRRWWEPRIHRQEFVKWANSDRALELLRDVPQAVGLIEAHLLEIDLAMMMQAAGEMSPKPGEAATGDPNAAGDAGGGNTGAGSGMAMANSNQNSGSVESLPGGPSMQQGGQLPM